MVTGSMVRGWLHRVKSRARRAAQQTAQLVPEAARDRVLLVHPHRQQFGPEGVASSSASPTALSSQKGVVRDPTTSAVASPQEEISFGGNWVRFCSEAVLVLMVPPSVPLPWSRVVFEVELCLRRCRCYSDFGTADGTFTLAAALGSGVCVCAV